VKRLPDGLQTYLGEGGGLVSGGEGQRVRMGRAMGRNGVRLAILDEPARGLDREQRRTFLEKAREHFQGATLFFITHDVTDTLDFNRVLVMERGTIIEDGDPHSLFENTGSRFRALCNQEEMVRRHIWAHPMWRRLRMHEGAIEEIQPQETRSWTHASPS
jgi:ATP-binding cassette subfamily B protein